MSRLIDADALKKKLCKEYRHFDQRIKISPVFQLIRDAPTIEPERKVGKWIRTRTVVHDGELYCDQCGQEHPEQKLIWNYCPNCGSRMLKEGDDLD